MADIALIWNAALGEADLQIVNGDLQVDEGLQTAAIVSLFSDALAQPGDEIPDGTSDRRGWWGDMPVDPAETDATALPDYIGSGLWLLDRALQTDATLVKAQGYGAASLQWMRDDNVAGAVSSTASYPRQGWIELLNVIEQQGASTQFTTAWRNS